MGDPKNNIEKYLKGELSQAEMHKLEMRALHDPFLADALEGADLTTPEQFVEDVNFLNKKIKSKSTKRYYWPLRIAASILLIISITYLLFQISPEDSNKPLALKKENKTEEAITDKKLDPSEDVKNNTERKEKSKLKDEPVAKPKTIPNEIIASKQTPQPSSEILEEAISSIPQAELEDTELEKVNEDEALFAQDLNILENAEVAQLKTETRRMKSDALKKSASPSSLSGAGSKEMKSSEAVTIASKPIIGREEFKNYLIRNVRYPKDAIDNKISGEVIVSFFVDMDGAISDFKIEKSIGFGCDEELVRLIKSGPAWTPALEKGAPVEERARVSFIFDPKN